MGIRESNGLSNLFNFENSDAAYDKIITTTLRF